MLKAPKEQSYKEQTANSNTPTNITNKNFLKNKKRTKNVIRKLWRTLMLEQSGKLNNGFKYYRECPTCGHREEITLNEIPQTPEPKMPERKAPDTISEMNADGGGIEAGWK